MSSLKPLKLFHHGGSPNPWKTLLVIIELDLPYELIKVADVKSKEFLAVNPNGRVPALTDLNTGITTWESGSNIEYLVSTYDKDHKLSYTTPAEMAETRNWSYFQASGQGPYFGQKAWFTNYHPEKLPSAIARYEAEIHRVLGVIELHLTETGKPYLVGDRITYADLMWAPYNALLAMPFMLGGDFDFAKSYPKTAAWHQRIVERPAYKAMGAEWGKAAAA